MFTEMRLYENRLKYEWKIRVNCGQSLTVFILIMRSRNPTATPGLWKGQSFSICHADSSEFAPQGLRSFFEYRQLGVGDATNGQFGAHVIRAIPGKHAEGDWHTHELDFQMVYVTRGWIKFEYEGSGEHILRQGSCVVQPPGIRHREVQHSDDLELVEITSPASFNTRVVDNPSQ